MKKLVLLLTLTLTALSIAFGDDVIRDEHGNVIGRKDGDIIRNEHGK